MPTVQAETTQHTDESYRWMTHALELAERGIALASPNPLVGAVLVKNGEVVGEAFHTYDGKKHAEVLALEQAGSRARGATLYINLEPCCHTGRTGPCTQALIEAGVSKVVAAMEDPNPQVRGKGFESLRQAGVSVETGLCREEAQRLNEAFAKYIRTGLPLVTLKAAMTLDGKIAATGKFSWVTSETARAHVQRQRHLHDAILTGIGTVLTDDPLLTDRTGLPRRRPLLRVIMDSHLRLPLAARMLQDLHNDLLIFCSASADRIKRELLLKQRGVRVCVAGGDGRPDLPSVLEELARQEITSVFLEAGSVLNGAALEAGVVDKVFLYYAPKILGVGEAMPLAAGSQQRSMGEAFPVHKIRPHQFGDDFAVEGYLRDVYE